VTKPKAAYVKIDENEGRTDAKVEVKPAKVE
jgi:hypothetical protein